MKKTTLLVALCVFMGLINVGLLWWMLSGPPHLKHEGPRNIIIERLDFDAGQGARYDVLIADHRKSIRAIEKKIFNEKNALFSLLDLNGNIEHDKSNETDESKKSRTTAQMSADSIAGIIGQLQREIELVNFHHFSELRSICRPNQIANYNALCSELAELFAPPHMGGGRKDGPPR
ncbi:MAG: hypothetical protein HQ472_06670 [Ignavibacteria bacterium]|nr:hypothetical protein [Ignavibacteria bacterium]